MSGDKKICVGSRKSELALIQTRHVISILKTLHPDKEFEIVTMSTLGDKVLDIPLPKIGEKSLFTKELETALSTGCVDFVVHSLKDLPTTLPNGMAIGAVLEREDPRDALVLHQDCKGKYLDTLPKDSVIGTSSLRRSAQLARKYPHLKVENIRGNLNTRLKKLDDLGKFQGLILATAGLKRMGWNHRISKIIDEDDLLYAVGQGALAVECRENDSETLALLQPLYDANTALKIITERSFLKTLGGGCSAPVAVKSSLATKESNCCITLTGAVWSLDGTEELVEDESCNIDVNNRTPKCKKCPYNIKCTNETDIISSSSNNGSKRCISSGKECPYSENGIPKKKQKIEDYVDSNKKENGTTNNHLLDEDPHKHCPIEIPIGLDFMGKCPYLEQLETETISKCPVNGQILGKVTGDITKCPYMKDGKLQLLQGTSSTNNNENDENANLFCGLVAHPDMPLKTLKEAENLGIRLAKKLMSKGASEIMAKAQATIHNSL